MDFTIRKKVYKNLYFILGRILKNNQHVTKEDLESIDQSKIIAPPRS